MLQIIGRTERLAAATHLFEGVACDSLESLLYVDGFFGAGLKVGNVVLTLAPSLSPFGGYLRVGENKTDVQVRLTITGKKQGAKAAQNTATPVPLLIILKPLSHCGSNILPFSKLFIPSRAADPSRRDYTPPGLVGSLSQSLGGHVKTTVDSHVTPPLRGN